MQPEPGSGQPANDDGLVQSISKAVEEFSALVDGGRAAEVLTKIEDLQTSLLRCAYELTEVHKKTLLSLTEMGKSEPENECQVSDLRIKRPGLARNKNDD